MRSRAVETGVVCTTVAGRWVIASATRPWPSPARAMSDSVMIPTRRPPSTTGRPWDRVRCSLSSTSLSKSPVAQT